MSRPTPTPGRFAEEADLAALPRVGLDDPFPFVCAGCGDCCRARRDIVLSGLDLYRLASAAAPAARPGGRGRSAARPPACCRDFASSPPAAPATAPFFEGERLHRPRGPAAGLRPLPAGPGHRPGHRPGPSITSSRRCAGPGQGSGDGVRTLRTCLEESGVLERAGGGRLLGAQLRPAGPAAWPLCRAAPGCRPVPPPGAAGAVLRLRFPGTSLRPSCARTWPGWTPCWTACRAETSGGARPVLCAGECASCAGGRPMRDGFPDQSAHFCSNGRPEIIENNKKITKRT